MQEVPPFAEVLTDPQTEDRPAAPYFLEYRAAEVPTVSLEASLEASLEGVPPFAQVPGEAQLSGVSAGVPPVSIGPSKGSLGSSQVRATPFPQVLPRLSLVPYQQPLKSPQRARLSLDFAQAYNESWAPPIFY